MKDFIFIHITRTGGTSIIKALRPFSSLHSFGSHHSVLERMDEIGECKFQSLFSFAIARNPWDRQVSFYHYILRDKSHHLHQRVKACGGFKGYVKEILEPEDTCVSRLQKDFVNSVRGILGVKLIGRFENLERWYENICLKIGILDLPTLPKLNVSVHKPYQEYYDDETMRIIRRIFEPDLDWKNLGDDGFTYRF